MPRTSLKTTCLCLLLGILASGAATLLERLQETPPGGVLEIGPFSFATVRIEA